MPQISRERRAPETAPDREQPLGLSMWFEED